jgi:hypothetical protein
MRGTWQTTDSGGGPGVGLVLAVIAAAVLIGSGAASAIASALVTILIITGCIMTLAVLGSIAWIVHRARQDRPGRPIAVRPVYRLPSQPRPGLEASSRPALEPGRGGQHLHLHLDGADPQVIAAIMRHIGKDDR